MLCMLVHGHIGASISQPFASICNHSAYTVPYGPVCACTAGRMASARLPVRRERLSMCPAYHGRTKVQGKYWPRDRRHCVTYRRCGTEYPEPYAAPRRDLAHKDHGRVEARQGAIDPRTPLWLTED